MLSFRIGSKLCVSARNDEVFEQIERCCIEKEHPKMLFLLLISELPIKKF